MEKILWGYKYPITDTNFSKEYEHGFMENRHFNKFYAFMWSLFITIFGIVILKLKEKKTKYYNVDFFMVFVAMIYHLGYVLTPLLLPGVVLLFLYRQAVSLLLSFKHGKCFGGLLNSADTVWAIEDISKRIINVVIILKTTSNHQELTQKIKYGLHQSIEKKRLKNIDKVNSTYHECMGYFYLLKNKVTVDDCLRTVNIDENKVFDEDYLRQIIGENSNLPLPKDGTALWEFLICDKKISVESGKGILEEGFPVIIRLSHILGDGSSLLNLAVDALAGGNGIVKLNELVKQKLTDYKKKQLQSRRNILTEILKNVWELLNILFLGPAHILSIGYFRKTDVNNLHGNELSGEKFVVWAIEESEELVLMVKNAKKRMKDVAFSDIMLASIANSLAGYFKRNSYRVPYMVSAAFPILTEWPSNELKNSFTVGIANIPMPRTFSMRESVEQVRVHTKKLKESVALKITYLLMNYVSGIFPVPLLRKIINVDSLTLVITNVPGLPKMTLLENCELTNMIFFPPHSGKIGLGFSIFTYNDKFHLGFFVDKALLSSSDEAQNIVDDIFRNIKKLNRELIQ